MKKAQVPLEKLLAEVRKRVCVYDILFRNAGVGILFYDPPAHWEPESPYEFKREFLVVHRYYPTLRAALRAELRRLK